MLIKETWTGLFGDLKSHNTDWEERADPEMTECL